MPGRRSPWSSARPPRHPSWDWIFLLFSKATSTAPASPVPPASSRSCGATCVICSIACNSPSRTCAPYAPWSCVSLKGHGPVPRRTKCPREARPPRPRIPVIRWPGTTDEPCVRIGRPAGFNRLQLMDIAHGFWQYSAAFRQQPRDRGAQLGDAFATARRGEDRLRKRGGTFVHEGERGGEASFPLGGFHFVLLRQDDLIGHRGSIEKIQHLDVDRFCAVTAIDEKKHAQQRHPAAQEIPYQPGPGRGFFLRCRRMAIAGHIDQAQCRGFSVAAKREKIKFARASRRMRRPRQRFAIGQRIEER